MGKLKDLAIILSRAKTERIEEIAQKITASSIEDYKTKFANEIVL